MTGKRVKGFRYEPKYTQNRYYLNIFRNHWKDYYSRHSGEIKEYQKKVVERFIKCGDPKEGYALVECPNCGESYFIPFSCKSRTCSSCEEKRIIEWSDWLCEEVLLPVNHRHITWTIPSELNKYFIDNIWLLKQFMKTADDIAKYYYCTKGKAGIITALHTAGSRITVNVHAHMLLTECQIKNGFLEEGKTLEEGVEEGKVLPLPSVPFRQINHLWRNKILALLCNTGNLDKNYEAELKKKYPKGFIVYHTAKSTSNNPEEAKRIASYLLRPPVQKSKIIRYDQKQKKVTIRYKCGVDGCFKNIYKHESMDTDEFIRRTIQHILSYHIQKIRYIGLYSQKFRGMQNKRMGIETKKNTRNNYRVKWRKLIKRIFQIDPMECMQCGKQMKIKKIITRQTIGRLKEFTQYKYYISGRWRKEKRKEFTSPPGGIERRRAA